jgi:hypothetical protein
MSVERTPLASCLPIKDKVLHAPDDPTLLERLTAAQQGELPRRIATDPERVERDLARVVLGVVDLLRQVLERQAVRRVESGSLSEEQIERLGLTLLKLEARMNELRDAFGLKEEELTLNLGSLRDLAAEFD